MTREDFQTKLTDAQRAAFDKLLAHQTPEDCDRLLASAHPPTTLCPYVSIPNFHGMFVGIEPDGYTHT